ncbi:hypothetical protein K438DRAFT_1098985 [Mycena galopus ATCC 62051]|nr:hypothetical protein K438DRAFT_1098985 [Mycena galopus ATCC 62051]
MLIMRTYAIFDSSKKILMFLLVMMAVSRPSPINPSAHRPVDLPTVEIFIRSLQYGQPPGTINGCYPVAGSEIIFVSFIAILLFETIIVALTFYIAWKHYRSTSNLVIKTLYHDSLFFFLVIFSITLANVLKSWKKTRRRLFKCSGKNTSRFSKRSIPPALGTRGIHTYPKLSKLPFHCGSADKTFLID